MSPTLTVNHKECLSSLRHMAGCLIAIFAMAAFANCGSGCLPVKSADQMNREYEDAIANCSKRAATKADAKYCRQDVNRAYGLCDEPWPAITPCDE